MEKKLNASQRQPEEGRPADGPLIWKQADSILSLWEVGDLILNQYSVMSKLGEGGMGTVYKVHDRKFDVDLAVKSPRPEIFTRADGKENFIREAEIWMKLRRHPHVVQCFFVHMLGGIPRIFAEYVEGGSLAEWIRGRTLYTGGERVALARMLDVAVQVAWGLHAAHEQGLVHQDVKPANVMLTSQGIAKVTDFGIAKARVVAGDATGEQPEGEQQQLVSWAGMTPAYCSPEQAARKHLSRQSDIWSWGLSVLHMFVGKVTWMTGLVAREALAAHERVDPAIPPMPPSVVKLLSKCFEPQPENRPATMLEVATELQAIYAQVVGRAYPRVNPPPADLDAGTLTVQGIALDLLGRSQEALALYEQAIRLNPKYAAAQHNRGLALLQLGRHEEALAAYEQAIRLAEADIRPGKDLTPRADSDLCETYQQKGLALRRLGRQDEALSAFEQALRLNPMVAGTHNNYGNVLYDLGRKEEALAAYEQAIHLDPTYAIAYLNQGNVLLQFGRHEEALASFEQARHLDPTLATRIDKILHAREREDAVAYLNASVDLLEQRRPEEALGGLEKAIELDPTVVEAYLNKGVALKRLGRLQEALAAYEQAIGLNPKLALAYSNKGNVFLDLGRLEEALAAYEQAINLDPGLVLAHNNKGNVLLQLGRLQEALDSLEQAIRLDPTFAPAHQNKRRALLQLEKQKEAQAASEQIHHIDSTPITTIHPRPSAASYHNEGIVLLKQGEPQAALGFLEAAISLDPTFADAHYSKGVALAQMGRREQALAAYEQAINLDPAFAQYWRMMLAVLAQSPHNTGE